MVIMVILKGTMGCIWRPQNVAFLVCVVLWQDVVKRVVHAVLCKIYLLNSLKKEEISKRPNSSWGGIYGLMLTIVLGRFF